MLFHRPLSIVGSAYKARGRHGAKRAAFPTLLGDLQGKGCSSGAELGDNRNTLCSRSVLRRDNRRSDCSRLKRRLSGYVGGAVQHSCLHFWAKLTPTLPEPGCTAGEQFIVRFGVFSPTGCSRPPGTSSATAAEKSGSCAVEIRSLEPSPRTSQ